MDGREFKQYERWKEEVQSLRAHNQHLQCELSAALPALYQANQKIDRLEQRVAKLEAENAILKQRVKDLLLAWKQTPQPGADAAAFGKPSTTRRRRKKPGRKQGHPAALRPLPDHIDVHQDVPLLRGPQGRECCPCCNGCLVDLEDREHLVEDLIPAKVLVTCYH